MKTILVPLDFSATAHHALQYAAKLATFTKARLVLYHNVPLKIAIADSPVLIHPDPELQAFYSQKLQKQVEQLRREGNFWYEVETVCQTGDFIGNMNRLVQQYQADLVVMGTKGAGNFIDRIAGTVTAGYMKEAICPVLVVSEKTALKLPKHIAYATDFENEETTVIPQLLSFTKTLKGTNTLINIQSAAQLNMVVDNQILEEITDLFTGGSFSIYQVQEDDVAKGLESFVLANDMDILAVAIRVHRFPESLFHSSVTQKLAYDAAVPLLTFPEHPYKQVAVPVKKKRKFEVG